MAFNTDQIVSLLEQHFEEEGMQDCFVVEVVHQGKSLEVFVDRDKGINLETCRKLSRVIEAYLDTSLVLGEEYVLDVSSPGVGRPLKLARQYVNNIGRGIEVKSGEEKIEGTLTAADSNQIEVSYTTKVKEGKKNVKVDVVKQILIEDIEIAKIKVSFK